MDNLQEEKWIAALYCGDCGKEGVEILIDFSRGKSRDWFEQEPEYRDLSNEEKRVAYYDFHYQDITTLDKIREYFEGIGFREQRNEEEEADILLDCMREFNYTISLINEAACSYGQVEDLVKEINIDLYYTQFERNINYRGFEQYALYAYNEDKIDRTSIDIFIKDISKMNEKELDKTLDFEEVYYQISLVIPEKLETSDLKILVETDTRLVNKFGLDNFSLSMIEERERFIEKIETGHWAGKALLERSVLEK